MKEPINISHYMSSNFKLVFKKNESEKSKILNLKFNSFKIQKINFKM